jgi:thioredoxin-like negative regulator of GroEL
VALPLAALAQDKDQPRRIPTPKKPKPEVPDSVAKAAEGAAAPREDSVAPAPAAEVEPPEEEPIWYDKYADAVEAARRNKRQLLLVFQTEWCKWCQMMNEKTWQDETVLSMAKSLVFTRVDGDLDTTLVTQFRVNRFPTAILASDQGVEADRFVGYFEPREMQEELTRALEGTGTMWELERKLTEMKNDPKIMIRIAQEFIERNEPERANEYLERVKMSDQNGALGTLDDALYVGAMIERNDRNWYKAIENLKQLLKKFPDSEWREDAELYIPWLLAQAGDDEEALKKYNEFLDKYGSSSETQWVKRQIAKLEPEQIPTEVPIKPEGQ